MAGNEMDAHSTLNDLRYPRTDWGLRCGAFLAIILCTISVAVQLSSSSLWMYSTAGFVISIFVSCSIGAAFGFAIQRWVAKKAEREADEFRYLRKLETERQLGEFRKANNK
ncbi:component of SufBCD complex [Leisingera sp. JC1]|uniref:component of SufBCD complex n=1 Tax=Leisingera sp. JC1 TaxID=1855282 RepID=UPI0008038B3C|nr:component of SufBCD complex [Leisingera sp. JC1]OBY27333.1 component of SufBCD complex [Leisingera sp. JC1]